MGRKRCRMCNKLFQPQYSTMQITCSVACAHQFGHSGKGQEVYDKARRKEKRETKARLKAKGDWLGEAKYEFNKWIRNRDAKEGCISCGTRSGQMAAGHYKTVGAHPELRFEPDNVHKQCNRNCNKAKSGNLTNYRINLVKKIGLERVEWLEGPHKPKHYTIEDIKDIKRKYQQLNKQTHFDSAV